MKKLFTILTVVALSTTMSFAQTEKGTFHIAGNIGDVAWTDWAVSPTVGYFISDGFAVALGFSMASGDAVANSMTLAPSARYYFNDLMFAQGGLSMSSVEDAAGDTETTTDIVAGVGLSLMWMDRVAIEPTLTLGSGEDVMTIGMGLGIAFRIGSDE
jgi:hypothetical protein